MCYDTIVFSVSMPSPSLPFDGLRNEGCSVRVEPVKPHCPKCKGKPRQGQRKLAETERDSLTGAEWNAVSARFGTAFVCKQCSAIYSHRDGFSTYIARLRE
jgi:hypothetical protein